MRIHKKGMAVLMAILMVVNGAPLFAVNSPGSSLPMTTTTDAASGSLLASPLHPSFSRMTRIPAAPIATSTSAEKSEPVIPVGKVVWVKGTFSAIMPNKQKRDLQKNGVIYLHDTLVTDAKTQSQIVFTDHSMITFREGTKFFIKDYEYKPEVKKGSVGKYFMNLIEGGFRTITGLIPKGDPKDYGVKTPTATIGVRGTDYAVYLKADGQLYVGNYAGAPCVSSGDGNSLCLSKEKPYAYVPNEGAAIVPLEQRPGVFDQKLVIVPVKITPFSATDFRAPNVTSSGPSSSGTSRPSFCIVQ